MTLFPLDTVRNARIDRLLEPLLEEVRGEVARFRFPDGADLPTVQDVVEVFDMARPRLNVLLASLGGMEGRRGADVSTGFGFLPVLLARRGVHVVATERDTEVGAFARSHGIEVLRYHLGRTPPPLAPASLDFLVFAEVLEHLKLVPAAVIGEMASLLRPGGRFLLTTPNVARMAHVEALVSGENFLEPFPEEVAWGADATDALEHVREYSVREVVEAVEAASLAVDEVVMTGWGEAGYNPPANPFAAEIMVVRATR